VTSPPLVEAPRKYKEATNISIVMPLLLATLLLLFVPAKFAYYWFVDTMILHFA
jgi:hypothetical protein